MLEKLKHLPIIALIGLTIITLIGFIKYNELVVKIELINPKAIEEQINRVEKQITVNQKEIEILKAQIKELKIKSTL